MENRNKIVRIWIARSKDETRPRKDRARCWAKALELAADAPGYVVLHPENGRTELHRLVSRRPAPARASKYYYREGGELLETARVYRTREDGKPRVRRFGGSAVFGMKLV